MSAYENNAIAVWSHLLLPRTSNTIVICTKSCCTCFFNYGLVRGGLLCSVGGVWPAGMHLWHMCCHAAPCCSAGHHQHSQQLLVHLFKSSVACCSGAWLQHSVNVCHHISHVYLPRTKNLKFEALASMQSLENVDSQPWYRASGYILKTFARSNVL